VQHDPELLLFTPPNIAAGWLTVQQLSLHPCQERGPSGGPNAGLHSLTAPSSLRQITGNRMTREWEGAAATTLTP
jgi:hypothetical protein